jgi:hypothetical protein
MENYFFFKFVFAFLIIVTKMAVSSFDSCNKPDSLFLGRMIPSTVNYQLTKQADDTQSEILCVISQVVLILHF